MPYCHFILDDEKVFTEDTYPNVRPWYNIRCMCRYCGVTYAEANLQRGSWYFHHGYCSACDPKDGGSFFDKRLDPSITKLLPKAILRAELERELAKHGEVL